MASYREEQAKKLLEYYQGMSGTMDRPSSMASQEEKEAYAAQQVQAGELPSSALSESYGGRPTGASRRAIRMQAEYDKRRATQIEEQRALQAMDIQQKQFEMSLRDQQMQEDDYYYKRGLLEAEQKLKAQQTAEAKEFMGAVNSLDPRSPEYRDQLIELRKQYPLGTLDPTANSLIGEYDKVHSVYMDAQKESQQDVELDQAFRVQQEATAAKYGVDTEKFVKDGALDRVGLMRSIGEAQRNELEEKEKNVKQAKIDEETKGQANQLTKEMRELRDEIELKSMQVAGMKGRVKEEAMIELEALNRRYERRVNELDQITLPKLTKEDKQAYDELPEGSEFFLDGRKVRKPKSKGGAKTEQSPEQATPAETPTPEPAERPTPTPVAASRPEPTLENVAPEALKREIQDEQTLREERDRLYRAGYRFSQSKQQRDLYGSVAEQLTKARENKNKEKYKRITEIRKRMKEIGAFTGDPKLREEYSRLQQEREVLLGA